MECGTDLGRMGLYIYEVAFAPQQFLIELLVSSGFVSFIVTHQFYLFVIKCLSLFIICNSFHSLLSATFQWIPYVLLIFWCQTETLRSSRGNLIFMIILSLSLHLYIFIPFLLVNVRISFFGSDWFDLGRIPIDSEVLFLAL